MESCKTCLKSPPEVDLKRCSRCLSVKYCSQECQKGDWKAHRKACKKQSEASAGAADASANANVPKPLDKHIADPFTRLGNGTWLHDRPERDVYRLLVDAYRMHVEDQHAIEGDIDVDSLYGGASSGLAGFRRFMRQVEAAQGGRLLPPWWKGEQHRAACERLGMDRSQWSDLHCAVEKSDVSEHYGDPRFPMQLRMFAEAVLGRGPGGADGAGMRAMMAMMEQQGRA